MIIYKEELKAGLADQLKEGRVIAMHSPAQLVEPTEHITARLLQSKASKKDTVDLAYIESILVTTGWNKNEAVFDRAEVWAAKATPEDKQFNYEHDCADIIGHTVACLPVDMEYNFLDAATIDDLPAQYHIHTTDVLYKSWSKEDLQARMDTLLAEIAEGAWFVSMECLFPTFDYALRNSQGEHKIVARNEETAFLTPRLRFFGGDGTYQDWNVGILPRNLTFSGKGLVRKPANPHSIIFSTKAKIENFSPKNTEIFPQKINRVYSTEKDNKQNKEQSMADNEELKAAKAEIEQLKKDMHESNVKKVRDELAATQEAKAKLEADLKELTQGKANADKLLSEAQKMIETLSGEKESLTKELTTVQAAKAELDAKQKKADRLALAIEKLHIKQEDEDKRKTLASFIEQTITHADEAFAAQLELMSVMNPAPSPDATMPAGKGPVTQPGSEATVIKHTATEKALEEAKPDAEQLSLASGETDEQAQLMKEIAAHYGVEQGA